MTELRQRVVREDAPPEDKVEELVGERHPDFGHDRVFLHYHLPGTNGFDDDCYVCPD
uniref:CDP-diacylglycerol synthase 2 n=1 Tax=Mus musculus TaxID=10090 RepID=H3BKR7_MOUSE